MLNISKLYMIELKMLLRNVSYIIGNILILFQIDDTMFAQ